MELFDKKFVHFMWDDKLEGKAGFFSDEICGLIELVNGADNAIKNCVHSGNIDQPFQSVKGIYAYRFFYYDPNYEIKRDYYKEDKKVQVKKIDSFADWVDCDEPLWSEDYLYRMKPECPCEDGIDSKACVGCEHSEDGKQYRPYRDALEFIADYGKRFPTAAPRPLGTMPLIWIAHKTDGTTRLIVEFSDRSVKIGCKVKPVDFGKLFEYWTYTDGSPVGMEVKE